jgi:hypothetical protein
MPARPMNPDFSEIPAAPARAVANELATRSDARMRARPCLAGVLVASSLLTTNLPAQTGAADGAAPAVRAADRDPVADACAWLAQPAATRGEAPGAEAVLAAAEVAPALARLTAAWHTARAAAPWADLALCTAEQPGLLRTDGFTMPYVFWSKGEKPANGWPLFLCLHGGGGNDQADGPHG